MCKRLHIRLIICEAGLLQRHLHRVVQHLAIRTILLLDVVKLNLFPSRLQRSWIDARNIVRRQALRKEMLNGRLPVDQGAITIKGDGLR